MSAPAPTAVADAPRDRARAAFRSALARLRGPNLRGSAWGARAPLILVLAFLLLAGAGVLVAYHGFYDARFRALEATRAELTERREALAAATEKVKATELRLHTVQKDLETFNKDILGTRKERLAAIIEDVYALTQKAGLVPTTISYTVDDNGAAERLALSFNVSGRYADVKKLLFSFENNPRFLLLENVGVATDDVQPDSLRLSLIVSHYFRTDGTSPRRGGRAAARAAAPRATPAAAKPTPAAGVPE